MRDVYLPEGKWIDLNTSRTYEGPITLKNYDHNGPAMPVFVGRKGVTVSMTESDRIQAEIWQIKPVTETFTHEYLHYRPDRAGDTPVMRITLSNPGWAALWLNVGTALPANGSGTLLLIRFGGAFSS